MSWLFAYGINRISHDVAHIIRNRIRVKSILHVLYLCQMKFKNFFLIIKLPFYRYKFIRPSHGVGGARGGGGGGTCSLVPSKNGHVRFFPQNKVLFFYIPCSQNLPVFPYSPYF